jgi:DNA-binding transcriptional MerR regulator
VASKSDNSSKSRRGGLGGLSGRALAAAEAARAAGEGELDDEPLAAPALARSSDATSTAAPADEEADGPDGPEGADGAEIPDKLYFRIGEVAQLVGVDAHVLRYWESEFRMKPHRSASGQRLYRKTDLSRFLRIRHLLHDEGYTIAGARRVLAGSGESTGGIDPTQVKAALDQLATLRGNIQAFRDDMELEL